MDPASLMFLAPHLDRAGSRSCSTTAPNAPNLGWNADLAMPVEKCDNAKLLIIIAQPNIS